VPVPPLVSVATHRFGRKLLMRLLSPATRHLEPDEEALFGDSATSKKDPSVRRKEHVAYLRSAMLNVFTKYAALLLRDVNGCKVLELVVCAFYTPALLGAVAAVFASEDVVAEDSPDMEEADGSDSDSDSDSDEEEETDADGEALKAAEDEAKAEESESDDESDCDDDEDAAPAAPALPIEEDKVAHAALKRLLIFETSRECKSSGADYDLLDESAPSDNALASPLLEKLQAQEGLLTRWVSCNRACFALNSMLAVPSVTKALIGAMKSADIASQLTAADAGVGAKALAASLGLGGKKAAASASKKKTSVKASPAVKKRKA